MERLHPSSTPRSENATQPAGACVNGNFVLISDVANEIEQHIVTGAPLCDYEEDVLMYAIDFIIESGDEFSELSKGKSGSLGDFMQKNNLFSK